MDQRRIAGLGNIYVAEALFRAGIHPAAPARRVRGARARAARGDPRGRWRAASRGAGRRCATTSTRTVAAATTRPRCWSTGAPARPAAAAARVIKRRVDGGRATFFCPGCQRTLSVGAGQSAPRRNGRYRAYNADSAPCRLDCESFQPPSRSRKSGKATPAAAERSIDFDDGVGQIRIGRRADLELSLPFSPLSGVHARLVRASDSDQKTEHWVLEDLGSTNGTFVGGERLKPGIKRPADGGRADQARRDQADLRWRGSR